MWYNKFLVLVSVLFLAEHAEAQRSVDLSVSRLYKPEYIVSSKGTEVLFSFKNNGPDTISTQDSIVIFFIFNAQQSNLIVRKPTADVMPGDSQFVSINIGALPPVSNSGTTTFCINARLMNRSADSLKAEQGTFSDNQKCNSVYVNATGITAANAEDLQVKAWPNPSVGNLVLNFNNPTATETGSIVVMDMQGRIISQVYKGYIGAGRQEFTFNTSELAAGTYYYGLFLSENAVINNFIVFK